MGIKVFENIRHDNSLEASQYQQYITVAARVSVLGEKLDEHKMAQLRLAELTKRAIRELEERKQAQLMIAELTKRAVRDLEYSKITMGRARDYRGWREVYYRLITLYYGKILNRYN